MPISKRYLRLGIAALVLGVAAACAYVPFDAPRTPSQAFSATNTDTLHPAVVASMGPHPTRSAFFELSNGTDALGARLRLIEAAQHSIDISTFLVKPDTATKLIFQRLLDAADRGVRVRFLLDDVFTTASDAELETLNIHPNIELRLFNPTSRNAPKQMGFVWDFKRVNRRMHIKTFVMDSSVAIMGGRNYADEYYELKPTEAFADYDVLVFGPDAIELDKAFDTYWNDALSVPLANFTNTSSDTTQPINVAHKPYDISDRDIAAYRRAIDTPYLKNISDGTIPPFWGTSSLVVDTPDKLRNPDGKGPHILAEKLFAEMRNSTKQVTLITPYFVPENYGAHFFQDLTAQGLRVRIITNSLASNNHAYVHGGYSRHRAALLDAGVELYELRQDAASVLGLIDEGTEMPITLHTKMAILDDDRVFIGSLNLDPRSIKTNAEIGLFVNSSAYAKTLLARLEPTLQNFSYKVTIQQDGTLLWTYDNGKQIDLRHEDPDASGWRHFLAALPQFFGVEGLL